MPRRVSDYPDAFTGWNFISSIGSIISVAATVLFLQIVYLQLVKGKAVFGYPWAVPQLFSDYLRILKDKSAPGLEWALHNPPKPHAFTSLPLQSSGDPAGQMTDIIQALYAGGCLHTIRDMLVPTAAELQAGGIPLCDFNPGLNGVKHEAISATKTYFFSCRNCHMIMCKDCNQAYMLLILANTSLLPSLFNKNSYFTVLQLFSDYLRILKNKLSPFPPKPHAFTSLPLQSTILPVLIGLFSLIAGVGVILTLYNLTSDWLFLTNDSIMCDAPRAWGLYFQDSASPQMEALVELHDIIMYYLVAILFTVGWIQGAIIKNFESSKSPISNKYLNHGTLIELIWTITPALILVLIAFPSFKLLYLMDEVTDPSLSVLAEGHQWYWSYEYPDFLNSDGDFVEFDSYLVPESDLEEGALRMLEVDNRVILPEITHTRFILTAADVIHSFAIPALGVKCDA